MHVFSFFPLSLQIGIFKAIYFSWAQQESSPSVSGVTTLSCPVWAVIKTCGGVLDVQKGEKIEIAL